MAIAAETSQEQLNATNSDDGLFVGLALRCKVCSIAVKDMNVARVNVDVLKEVVPHKRVIALGVITGQTHILVHVKSVNMAETQETIL